MKFASLNWFFLIGVSSSAIYIVLSSVLNYYFLPAWQASVISFSACIPFAYYAQKSLAFQSNSPHRRAFPRYIVVQVMGLCLSAVIPRLLVTVNLSYEMTVVVFILVAGSTSLLSYLIHQRWTYSEVCNSPKRSI